MAWGFVEGQWSAMLERFPSNSIARMLEGMAAQADPELAARARAFLTAHPVKQGEQLYTGDLLVGMPGAAIDSADGAVRLDLLSDPDKQSPYPVLEAAVVLHHSAGHDLDFTLDRGRVNVTNRKKEGPAKVRSIPTDALNA